MKTLKHILVFAMLLAQPVFAQNKPTIQAERIIREGATATEDDKAWFRDRIDASSQLRAYLLAAKRNNFSRWPTMSAPPTVTRGGAASTVNATYSSGNTLYQPDLANSRFRAFGSEFTALTEGGSRNTLQAAHITDNTGTKGRNTTPFGYEFMSDEPVLDFCFLERSGSTWSVVIDGEIVAREQMASITNSGAYRYFNVSFGADALTYSKAATTITIANGGTGYAVGDLVTMDGGTNGTTPSPATVFRVAQVSSGAVVTNGVVIETRGNYTPVPTGVLSQVSTTGTGTGLQVNANFFSPRHTTRKMREWKIIVSGPTSFMGVVATPGGIFYPTPDPTWVPRAVVVGDSINAGTYLDYAAGSPGYSLLQSLGLTDNGIISAIGGTGWNAGTTPWVNANRVADIIRYNPDIIVFQGSQNDTSGAPLTAAVTSVINQVQAANPRVVMVGLSNILGGSTAVDSSIAAGFAGATDQTRVRYISTQQPIKRLDPAYYTTVWTVTGDANHPGQQGLDALWYMNVRDVFKALMDLTAR